MADVPGEPAGAPQNLAVDHCAAAQAGGQRRGPVWPFLNLLLGWAAARDQDWELHSALREASLRQLSDLTFAEYYEPITGEPLGSRQQAWTAAAALEWLG